MSIVDDLFQYAQDEGGDVIHTKKTLPTGETVETMMVGLPWEKTEMPKFGAVVPQERRSPLRSDNILLLPPREQFKTSLMLLMDRARATKTERSVVNRLIERFENGDRKSKKVHSGASQT